MTLSLHIGRLRRDARGAALVEFTLLAPVLIALMCGVAEFSQALRQYHVMEKGVRDAARYLSRVPADPCAAADPNWSTYVNQAKNLALYGSAASGSPLFKSWSSTATVSVPAPTCLANPRGGFLPRVTVTATAPYQDLGLFTVLGLSAPTLSVSHQELKVS